MNTLKRNWPTITAVALAAISTIIFLFGKSGSKPEAPVAKSQTEVPGLHELRELQNITAPVYGDRTIPANLQIPEETTAQMENPTKAPAKAPEPLKLPSSLDAQNEKPKFQDNKTNPQDKNQWVEENNLEKSAVALEAPSQQTTKEEVTTIDPREIPITANDGPDKAYEETSLSVQRTLTALLSDEEKQLIRMRVPVMFKSRTLRIAKADQEEAKRILGELTKKATELGELKKQLELLLKNWNQLVEKSTPHTVLLPESPTLPTNQSATKLNRENNAEMEPGKAISYEIINK